jgi:pancreatic triacylglycerol lipase
MAESWVQGFIKAALHSSAGVIHVDLTPGETKLEHGTTFTSVVSHPADLGGNIKKVELNWEYELNVLEPKTICLFWCNDHLYVESVSVDEMALPGREYVTCTFFLTFFIVNQFECTLWRIS